MEHHNCYLWYKHCRIARGPAHWLASTKSFKWFWLGHILDILRAHPILQYLEIWLTRIPTFFLTCGLTTLDTCSEIFTFILSIYSGGPSISINILWHSVWHCVWNCKYIRRLVWQPSGLVDLFTVWRKWHPQCPLRSGARSWGPAVHAENRRELRSGRGPPLELQFPRFHHSFVPFSIHCPSGTSRRELADLSWSKQSLLCCKKHISFHRNVILKLTPNYRCNITTRLYRMW